MSADLDAKVGILFGRLSLMRLEFDEAAFEQALHDLMQALGVAAMREAERRAGILRDRLLTTRHSIAVTPFAQRRPPDPLEGYDADR